MTGHQPTFQVSSKLFIVLKGVFAKSEFQRPQTFLQPACERMISENGHLQV